jgi:hypothetical protein
VGARFGGTRPRGAPHLFCAIYKITSNINGLCDSRFAIREWDMPVLKPEDVVVLLKLATMYPFGPIAAFKGSGT